MNRILYRDAALADGRSPALEVGLSLLVADGAIAWIAPTDAEPDPGGPVEVIDAGGATVVPGMVDAHSHLTLPGGSHWIARGLDPPETLLAVAEHNAGLQHRSGVRWARDVGSPRGVDPVDGSERALALGIRDRWHGRPGYPYVRAAGTWLARSGYLPEGLAVDVTDADGLLDAAHRQLGDGADLIKLMLDGPDPGTAPWAVHEVEKVVAAAHARGARVTAHSTDLAGARVAVGAGVDSIEHGFELDADLAADMAGAGTMLVATLTALTARLTFTTTTTIPRFAAPEGEAAIRERLEAAAHSIRVAHAAGVAIAAGTDFGGGSGRANQMAWEIESLVAAGLEPYEALAAATWRGGELLGEPEAGTIAPGGPPDFFLVHGDPLSDPAALWRVWRVAW
jgi:imidazolonepropionase-like amidohydrolase